MKKITTYLATATLCFTVGSTTQTYADPTGTVYGGQLYFVVVDSPFAPALGGVEGHSGLATFDGVSELLPLDFPTPPPLLPGNDLILTEHVTHNPDGTETIEIWIDGQDPGLPFPAPGFPLFANPLDLAESVLFEVFDLHWGSESTPPMFLSDLVYEVSFPSGVEEVIPLFEDIAGMGTPSDPLSFYAELDPFDFYEGGDPFTGDPATDFHFRFTVKHVPEPTTLTLIGLVLVGTTCLRRRRP